MKRYTTGILLFLMFSIAATGQDSTLYTRLSLKQAVELALKNNIDVKQSDLLRDVAYVNYNQARTDLLPSINGSWNYGFNQGRTIDPITNNYINQNNSSSGYSLDGSVVLFNGLRLQNLIKQYAYAYEAGKWTSQQERDNLTLNVVLAYLNILNSEVLLEIARSQADVTRKQVERMDVLVKEGAAGAYQLADLRGQLAGDEISIINNINNLQTYKITLSQLMNIRYNPELQLERVDGQPAPAPYPDSTDKIYELGIGNLAIIKATDLRIKSASKAVSAARGNYFPSVRLNANVGSSYSNQAFNQTPTSVIEKATGDYVLIGGVQSPVLTKEQQFTFSKQAYFDQFNNNRGTFYGVSVQIPILNGFFTRNQVKLAKINLKTAEWTAANVRLQLRQNVETAYQQMLASFGRYKALVDQVTNYEELFRATEVRFDTGVITAADYLLQKNKLDAARVNLADAQYELMFRTKVLDFYEGRLTL